MNDATESAPSHLELETLDPLVSGIIRHNREKVDGWIANDPGCWGFLAGKAVTACRAKLGRSLADQERRLVWRRLWSWLEQVKSRVGESTPHE